jgi:chorismate synthase
MAGNTFGTLFRVTTFGESHGGSVGCIIDGCPAGLPLNEEIIQKDLDRRRPGQSDLTTPRNEEDSVHIESGVFEGKTTGTPICLLVKNRDARPSDYDHLKNIFRPSHADFTYEKKYGIRDTRGGGRASARETVARVAAGAVARTFLNNIGIEFVAFVEQVHNITADIDASTVSLAEVDITSVRCPDKKAAKKMIALIKKIRDEGDSVGGVIRCIIRNVPLGLGEPVFDRLSARLGFAMLTIPATKGFEIGSGFTGTHLTGKTHNDEFFTDANGQIHTRSNNSGGVQGGISNGELIDFRVAFKPTSTIAKEQRTVDKDGKEHMLTAHGRHDPCVLPRAVPIVEAMAALTIIDYYLLQKIYEKTRRVEKKD